MMLSHPPAEQQTHPSIPPSSSVGWMEARRSTVLEESLSKPLPSCLLADLACLLVRLSAAPPSGGSQYDDCNQARALTARRSKECFGKLKCSRCIAEAEE